MQRLLCLLSSMNAGGAETFLMKIYRTLDRNLYQMDFCINVREKCFYEDEISGLGGKIFRIPSKSESLKGFKEGLSRIVRAEKYKRVLRINSNAMGFLDLKIAKKSGADVCISRSSNSSDQAGKRFKIANAIGRIMYGNYADIKIAPSDLAAEYTFGKRAVQKGKVHFLNNAVDLSVFHFDVDGRNKIREEFGIKDKTVIGHVGRFMEQKNHMFLLDVFFEIKKKRPDAVLMLVGTGELETAIKDKAKKLGIEKSLIFTGVRYDIPQILSAMDVMVFPSFYEGMPNAVIEAQAVGLPCIISDSITKEVEITEIIKRVSLHESAENWADLALEYEKKQGTDTKRDFIEHNYDIKSITEQFVDLVFNG